MRQWIRILLIPITVAACAGSAQAAEIRMLASNAVKQAYLQLLPQYEKTSHDTIRTEWAGTADIARRIAGGEADDVVIAPAATIDDLIHAGKLNAGSRVDVAKSPIGVAIRPGTPKPDLTSGESLKRSLVNSKSIVISAGPSGIYLDQLFRNWGIAGAIAAKTKRLPPGDNPGDLLARNEGDIGFTQISELLPVKGIQYLGPLPMDIQHVTVFSAGLPKSGHAGDAAKSLIRFLTTPTAAVILKNTGLDPG